MAQLPDPTIPIEKQPNDILSGMLVIGEAANQDDLARKAVVWSAVNRLLYFRKEYGGKDWPSILLHPGAYDCFTELRPKLLDPIGHGETQETWDSCYEAAQSVLTGTTKDLIDKATHYFDRSMDDAPPYWTRSPLMEWVCDVGDFHFWKYR